MPWQEIGVVIVVIGAVVYLARKLFGIGERKRKANTSFVSMDSLKKKRK
jgi:hypothetical protein